MDTSGPVGRRRPAPAATAVGYFPFPGAAAAASYFPFPGAPAVTPAEKREEDDEDDEDDADVEDDEDDEDDADVEDDEDEVSVQERACADAEALRWRLQSTKRRRADEVACAFAASGAASGPCTSDAFKLLASCVSCATAVVCVVALAAPVTDSPTGGGGAFRHMSGATERAREISRHRLQLQRESKRCRAEVEAHATELTRRRFGCGLRSAPNPPVGSFGSAGPGGEIFWGAEGPIPRGAHRVNELWSEPKSRLASAADAACSLLARASRVCSGGGSGASSSGGATRRGFERATRDLLA